MRLIDADALIDGLDHGLWGKDWDKSLAEAIIRDAPTIDAEPVVRCKDCIHLEMLNESTYYAKCRWHGRLFARFGRADTRNWFCADGERKDDEVHSDI